MRVLKDLHLLSIITNGCDDRLGNFLKAHQGPCLRTLAFSH